MTALSCEVNSRSGWSGHPLVFYEQEQQSTLGKVVFGMPSACGQPMEYKTHMNTSVEGVSSLQDFPAEYRLRSAQCYAVGGTFLGIKSNQYPRDRNAFQFLAEMSSVCLGINYEMWRQSVSSSGRVVMTNTN